MCRTTGANAEKTNFRTRPGHVPLAASLEEHHGHNAGGAQALTPTLFNEPVQLCSSGIIESVEDSQNAHSSSDGLSCHSQDVEKCSSCFEHVLIKFEGSSCPACTCKISKALSSMPFVRNFSFNSVMLQAEFELDLAQASIRQVIERVYCLSGYRGKRVGRGWLNLDILSKRNPFELATPNGVKDVVKLKGDVVSIKYDPAIIGARQLLKVMETNLGGPVGLAPRIPERQMSIQVRSLLLRTIGSSALTVPILILAWAPLPKRPVLFGAISLALATMIQIVVAGPFYHKAFKSLIRTRAIDMDLLIVLSTSTAFIFSLVSFICKTLGVDLSSELYFDTNALLITFLVMGRFLSEFACHRAIKSASIRCLQPNFVHLEPCPRSSIDQNPAMDVRLLQIGDKFMVRSGCTAATDGTLVNGDSEFDEALVTGEGKLIRKKIGSQIIAGSTNRGTPVTLQANRVPGANTITDTAKMVEQVNASRPRIVQLADRIAQWVVPLVSILCILTLLIHFAVGFWAYQKSSGLAMLDALPYAISVLVVSCPCAVAFAVPMVMVVASKIGAQYGIMFKSGEAITDARNVTHVVFDKTGTLTDDNLTVVSENYFVDPCSWTASLVFSLISKSNHVVSAALSKHLEGKVRDWIALESQTVIGKGIEGFWNGEIVRVGSAHWLGVDTEPSVRSLQAQGLTIVCASKADHLIATFGLAASPRPEARSVISRLFERGIAVAILSGDEPGAVRKLAKEVGVNPTDAKASCTPLEKQHYVEQLKACAANTVMFCGDGMNDAGALASANIGVHVQRHGLSKWSVGNTLISNPCLTGVMTLIDISKDAHQQIVLNFGWALLYNLVAILFAAGAFVKVRLPPEYAALGEAVSVLPVIVIPWRLIWRKYQ